MRVFLYIYVVSLKVKTYLSVLAVIFIGFHFFLLTSYLTHKKTTTLILNSLHQHYIYPVFHQDWKLFVPPPKENYSIYVRCKKEKGFTPWMDIYSQQIQEHQSNRFFGTEQKALMFTNSMSYIAHDTINICFESSPEDATFLVLKKIVKTELVEEEKVFSSFEMILKFKSKNKVVFQYYKNLN